MSIRSISCNYVSLQDKGASVAEHIDEFNMVIGQLGPLEIHVDNEICTLIILLSLPNT